MAEYCHALNIKIVNKSDEVKFSEAYFFLKRLWIRFYGQS